MTEEKKMQYVHLTLCKVAMLLFGLNLVRTLSIHHDQLGFLIGFIGYSLVSIHVRTLEKKWEIPKKYVWISLGIFALIFLPLAYWLAFPR